LRRLKDMPTPMKRKCVMMDAFGRPVVPLAVRKRHREEKYRQKAFATALKLSITMNK
jgi:hypothetical protein